MKINTSATLTMPPWTINIHFQMLSKENDIMKCNLATKLKVRHLAQPSKHNRSAVVVTFFFLIFLSFNMSRIMQKFKTIFNYVVKICPYSKSIGLYERIFEF